MMLQKRAIYSDQKVCGVLLLSFNWAQKKWNAAENKLNIASYSIIFSSWVSEARL